MKARIIDITRARGDLEEADRLSGKQGTGPECYPGQDNLPDFATLLRDDYGVYASVGYEAEGGEFGAVQLPPDTTLPLSFTVRWSSKNGVGHFDLSQTWIDLPVGVKDEETQSFDTCTIKKRKLLPGARSNESDYVSKWEHVRKNCQNSDISKSSKRNLTQEYDRVSRECKIL